MIELKELHEFYERKIYTNMHTMNMCTRSTIRANMMTYSQGLVHISTQEKDW